MTNVNLKTLLEPYQVEVNVHLKMLVNIHALTQPDAVRRANKETQKFIREAGIYLDIENIKVSVNVD